MEIGGVSEHRKRSTRHAGEKGQPSHLPTTSPRILSYPATPRKRQSGREEHHGVLWTTEDTHPSWAVAGSLICSRQHPFVCLSFNTTSISQRLVSNPCLETGRKAAKSLPWSLSWGVMDVKRTGQSRAGCDRAWKDRGCCLQVMGELKWGGGEGSSMF